MGRHVSADKEVELLPNVKHKKMPSEISHPQSSGRLDVHSSRHECKVLLERLELALF